MADILPDFTDKSRLLAHGAITVSTTQVAVRAGVSNAVGRETVIIYNDSNNTVYFGLTGVSHTGTTKGLPIPKQGFITIPANASNDVYLIAQTGSNTVLIFEFGDV